MSSLRKKGTIKIIFVTLLNIHYYTLRYVKNGVLSDMNFYLPITLHSLKKIHFITILNKEY